MYIIDMYNVYLCLHLYHSLSKCSALYVWWQCFVHLCTYLDIYIYIYICIYIYIDTSRIFIYIYIYVCMYISFSSLHDIHIHKYIHIHTYTYLHTYIHTYIHTYTPTHLHTYTHTHIHTYIHTYIHAYIVYIYIYIDKCKYPMKWLFFRSGGSTSTSSEVWSRKAEGRFPEAKELKQRVRDVLVQLPRGTMMINWPWVMAPMVPYDWVVIHIHKSHLFWCSRLGTRVLTHGHVFFGSEDV